MTATTEYDLQLPEDPCLVEIDRNKFLDVVMNLTINAKHALTNRHNAKFTISVKPTSINDIAAAQMKIQPGHYVKVIFEDNGHGIPKDIQYKIFDPFFSTKGEEGTGLGLSQVYGFVQRNHGYIKFKSEIEVGTVFSLYLPLLNDALNEGDKSAEIYTDQVFSKQNSIR